MASYNKVILLGNMTRDPELKSLPSGTHVCEFGLAMNRQWRDKNTGENREQVTYVDCKSMGRQAEVIHQYFSKGRPIMIDGRLDYRSWEAQDGSKRSKLEVFVENFQFVGGRQDEGGGGGAPRGPARQAPAAGRGGPPPAGNYDSGAGQAVADFDDDVPF